MTTEITEANFLDFTCPYCGELNSFPQDSAGYVRECVNCRESLIVPEAGSEAGLKIPVPITTPRLVLRRLGARDWKDLMEFRFTDEEEALRWLENDHVVKLTTPDQTFSLGVELRDGGKIIGCLGLKFIDQDVLQAEVLVSWNEDPQYSDFANEAVAGLLGFCFAGVKLHRVIAKCGSSNSEGCRMLEAAGMRREGEFVKNYYGDGEWLGTVWFAMLDEEYREGGSSPTEASST